MTSGRFWRLFFSGGSAFLAGPEIGFCVGLSNSHAVAVNTVHPVNPVNSKPFGKPIKIFENRRKYGIGIFVFFFCLDHLIIIHYASTVFLQIL